MEIDKTPKPNLPLLAIESAEDLARLKKNIKTDLKHAKELSELLEKNSWRLDYSIIFTEAYFNAYNKNISSENPKKYYEEIYKKLNSPSKLGKKLEGLINFCVKLSDSAALYKEEIERLKTPHRLVA